MAKDRKRLFHPLGWLVARAPLLPVEAYLGLAEGGRSQRLSDPAETFDGSEARMALLVGAGHLPDALQASDDGDADVRSKQLRYQIRMSTRPTPYGAFAGVALCDPAAATALAIDASRHRRSARPDMEWLLSFIAALEARDDVLRQLGLMAHPCLAVRGDRVGLDDPTPLREGAQPVSIRASEPVLAALDAARQPLPHDDLLRAVMHRAAADEQRSARLLRELVDQGLLLTDLRPPLTCAAPAKFLLDRLQSLAAPPEETARLSAALNALDAWARLEAPQAAQAWPGVDEAFGSLHAGAKTRIQVDLALGLASAEVGQSVLDDAAEIAQLLLKLSPQPHGAPALQAYRAAFLARYGSERRVPLLECLDAHTGLGPLGAQGHANVDGQRHARRQMALQSLAHEALVDGRLEVELDDALIERLALWEPRPEGLPISIDLCLMVLAGSAAAVNAGEYRVVVGPNLGSRQAGRYLGRFAELLGPRGHQALQDIAQREERHAGDALWAESVYLPKRLRSANVAIRPAVRGHEIALGVPASVAGQQAIALAELALGIRNDRLCLFRGEREVRVRAGHMLTSLHAPQASRFLEELGQDGVAQLSGFDWGPAWSYTFLPRVRRGRAVLAPAQWRISRELLGGKAALGVAAFRPGLETFCERWRMPRHVYLVEGDNRLLLDLHDADQADQLRRDLLRRGELGVITVQEALPAPEHAWVETRGGHAFVEFVVPLVRPAVQELPVQPAASVQPPAPALAWQPLLSRMRPPGSDWLFLKLYGAADREEALLAGPVREFCDAQVEAAHCASWFFIRYADPESHLRIRFRGDPNRLLADLLPEVCAWCSELMLTGQATRFAFDTYERELDRYGGPAGLAWAESLFAADSVSVADMLAGLHPGAPAVDRLSLLAISIDRFLADLGLDEAQRLDWARRHASRHASGEDYRHRKRALRAWFSPGAEDHGQPAWLPAWLEARAITFTALRERWAELRRKELLTADRDSLLRSLVHMHCNRFAGPDRHLEDKALGVLLRLRESLVKAPPGAKARRLAEAEIP